MIQLQDLQQSPLFYKGAVKYHILRAGGGEVWEDPTLLEWDPSNEF